MVRAVGEVFTGPRLDKEKLHHHCGGHCSGYRRHPDPGLHIERICDQLKFSSNSDTVCNRIWLLIYRPQDDLDPAGKIQKIVLIAPFMST